MNFRLMSVITLFAFLMTVMSPANATVRFSAAKTEVVPLGQLSGVATVDGYNLYKSSVLVDKISFTADGLAVHYLPTIDRIVVDKKTGLHRLIAHPVPVKPCKLLPNSLQHALASAQLTYAGASAVLLGAVGATAFADLTTFGVAQILLTAADVGAFLGWLGAEQGLESAESADAEWEDANNGEDSGC